MCLISRLKFIHSPIINRRFYSSFYYYAPYKVTFPGCVNRLFNIKTADSKTFGTILYSKQIVMSFATFFYFQVPKLMKPEALFDKFWN